MNKQIQIYGIQPGDKVSRLKRGVPFIRHYAVYLGTNVYGQHIVAENSANNGVQIVLADEFFRDASSVRVESTSKTWEQRQRAVSFAIQKVGQNYRLLDYNCEHFANEVTTGNKSSNQVTWGIGLTLLFVGGVIAKNSRR